MWGIVEPLQSILKAVLSMPYFRTAERALLEVWARTRQRNICAEIPVSRSITSRSERVQRHNAQSDGGQSTETVSERVPTRQRTANEQREMNVYSVQIWAVLSVFLCEGYNYTPYAFTVHCRASESHYKRFWKRYYTSRCILSEYLKAS